MTEVLRTPDERFAGLPGFPFEPHYRTIGDPGLGPLRITTLIPAEPDSPGIAQNRAAWNVLDRFERPFATAFSDADPSTAPWEAVFRARVPGAAQVPHVRIECAGHFVQEERGEALAKALTAFLTKIA